MGLVVPILPAYAAALGASASLVGLLLAGSGVARLVVALPAVWLAGRVGHRWLLVASPAITAPAAVLCALAAGFWSLALFCMVEHAAAAQDAWERTLAFFREHLGAAAPRAGYSHG